MMLPLSLATAALVPITYAKGEQLALGRTTHSLQSPLKPMEKGSPFFPWILDQTQRDLMV